MDQEGADRGRDRPDRQLERSQLDPEARERALDQQYRRDREENVFTEEQADISAIMQKIDSVASGVENLTKSFTGEKIDNLLGPFTDFIKANRIPLTTTIQNLQTISTQISQGQGTVGKLLHDETLYRETTTSMTNLKEILQKVNQGQGTIGKIINDQEIPGITGGALDSKEGEPGPLQIQGDHGPVELRNIVITPAKS